MLKYKEYKKLDLSQTGKEIEDFWDKHDVFQKSLELRKGQTPWVFYEGPPSANGLPGIHHVISRAIKDIFAVTIPRRATW
jgi:isoleucyl-tRNA synthetase